MSETSQRTRRADQLREVTIEPYPTAAPGSVIITQGQTRVLCTASLSLDVPPFIARDEDGVAEAGWVTAEYAMHPASTPDRKRRGTDSRGTEIKRLIGRSLRAAVDTHKMPGVAITCDCDVLHADGGTRTASVTGAYVALARAIQTARRDGLIQGNPLIGPVAAVSVGVVAGKNYLDLDYELDSVAEVDMNVVMNHRKQFIELQGTGEQNTFDRQQLDKLLDLAQKGIGKLVQHQRAVLR
jgi:ribonuclease PH